MSDFMTLIGYENVERAGQNMSHAAESMSRSAYSIDCSVDRMQRILEEHATRVEAAMEKKE